jgi:hypothetical protein
MSNNPEALRWQEPQIVVDEEEDVTRLCLGVVDIPDNVDLETTEKVLAVVTELVNQMVEEDIIPELLSPDNTNDYDDLSDIEIPDDYEYEEDTGSRLFEDDYIDDDDDF